VTEQDLSVKGRVQGGVWAVALAKEAAGVAWAALGWDLEAIAFAPVVARQWRTKWAHPAIRSSAPSAGSP
jgi:hypothetical protein